MQQRYFQGALQPLTPTDADRALRTAFAEAATALREHVERLAFHRALEALWRALDHANKYVVEQAPFTLAKDPAMKPRVGAILHELCEALRTTAQLVEPFLPETARKIVRFLGFPEDRLDELNLPWGTAFAPGHHTGPAEALFPRLETT
jgi:methionyl-tRNA synthetase